MRDEAAFSVFWFYSVIIIATVMLRYHAKTELEVAKLLVSIINTFGSTLAELSKA